MPFTAAFGGNCSSFSRLGARLVGGLRFVGVEVQNEQYGPGFITDGATPFASAPEPVGEMLQKLS